MKSKLTALLLIFLVAFPLYAGVWDSIRSAGQHLTEATKDVVSAGKEVVEQAKPAIQKTTSKLQDLQNKYGPQVSKLYESASSVLKTAIDKAQEVLQSETMRNIAAIASKYGNQAAQELYELGGRMGDAAAREAVRMYNKYGPEVGKVMTDLYLSAGSSLKSAIDRASQVLTPATMKRIALSAGNLGMAAVESIYLAGANFGEAAAKEALSYYDQNGVQKGNQYINSSQFKNKYR
ncbi:hypothetical protein [uncultured Sphaerochaeta sp.]|uniref:hypothetical protein n=1 Tax=uncultured Sphaerochaeta sp. TaxID=886478 RepID=UPI002A0A3237|nr:hypothetical protein [uncultured Sphaerochaeta sp.]